MRQQRRIGARRIQSELFRLQTIRLSRTTVQKVLNALKVKSLSKSRRNRRFKRCSQGIPGTRMQIDTIKVAPGLYQYTAIDDCIRFLMLGLFSRHSAANTLAFLDQVVEDTPFRCNAFRRTTGANSRLR